ncbi:MAG: Gldg family protein [Deltaproteobacteria bacterium]|nr:Gldg family protein [Deltaproteobacteria bacterium]
MKRSLRRRLSYGSNATLVTLLVVALVVLVYGLADRHRARWDLSAEGTNRLPADMRHKLDLLDQDGRTVTLTAFTAQSGKKDAYFKNRALKDLLEEVDLQSTAVESRLVDFDRERLTAEAMGVRDYATMVVQRGEERVDIRQRDLFRAQGKGADRSVAFLGEAALNAALSQIMSSSRRVVYTLRGHGEIDPEDAESSGMVSFKEALEQEHYDVEPLDLVRDATPGQPPHVPDDAAALVVARPRTALADIEHDALSAFLAVGGRLLVLLDVGLPVPRLVESIGILRPEGYVMDRVRIFPYDDRPVPVYRPHPITEDLSQERLVTVVAHAAPLQAADPSPAGVRVASLLRTSRDGWIDLGGALERGSALYEPGIDTEGPVDMAFAVTLVPGQGIVRPDRPEGRVVVVGDADCVTTSLFQEGPGNASFFVNAMRWLVGDDIRLSVVGRPTAVRRLALTETDIAVIRWLALALLPLLVVVAGAAVWASRRGR